MLQDLRIRDSNRPTKVPFGYHAYLYCWYGPDDIQYKVILAADKIHADQLLSDWCYREGLDNVFFRSLGEFDWMLAGQDSDFCDILL